MDEARTGKRFPLHLPIRLEGSTPGSKPVGSTDNLSAAGAYLVLDRGFDEGSLVNFEITIPASAIGTAEDVTVRCQGRVVRSDPKGNENGVACVIETYEFVRPGK